MFKKITPEKKVMVSLCLAYLSVLPVAFSFFGMFMPPLFLIIIPLYLLGILISVISIIFGIQGLGSIEGLFAKISIISAAVSLLLLTISLYLSFKILSITMSGLS